LGRLPFALKNLGSSRLIWRITPCNDIAIADGRLWRFLDLQRRPNNLNQMWAGSHSRIVKRGMLVQPAKEVNSPTSRRNRNPAETERWGNFS
jgi:hypothetical protein